MITFEAPPPKHAHKCGENCRHKSDCSVHNGPALPEGKCDCSFEAENLRILLAYEKAEVRVMTAKAEHLNGFDLLEQMRDATGWPFVAPAMSGWDFLRLAYMIEELNAEIEEVAE